MLRGEVSEGVGGDTTPAPRRTCKRDSTQPMNVPYALPQSCQGLTTRPAREHLPPGWTKSKTVDYTAVPNEIVCTSRLCGGAQFVLGTGRLNRIERETRSIQ